MRHPQKYDGFAIHPKTDTIISRPDPIISLPSDHLFYIKPKKIPERFCVKNIIQANDPYPPFRFQIEGLKIFYKCGFKKDPHYLNIFLASLRESGFSVSAAFIIFPNA